MASEPKMRHYSPDGQRKHVETWWAKRGKDGRAIPLRSDNLRPVSLADGLEATMAAIFRKLPKKEPK